MKIAELLMEKSNLSYDDKSKKIYGSAKEWTKAIGAEPEDLAKAFKEAESLPSYKALTKIMTRNRPKGREANGTFEFKKPGGSGLYIVLSNGQIRSESTGPTGRMWQDSRGPTRLKSPKPALVHGDPVKSLLKMYDNAFKELLDKIEKGAGK